MNIFRNTLIGAAAALACAVSAHAVTVSSYDITNAQLSGFGGWHHTYNGTIIGNNYSGGSGTLNDGIIPTDEQANQLFLLDDKPTITLHLSALTKVLTIDLFGGDLGGRNSIPGTLTGWDVTIGTTTMSFTSTPFGPMCQSNLCNDDVSLLGSGLDLIGTDTVVLSNFKGTAFPYFNIGEVEVNGDPAVPAVPEPETYALLLAGLAAVGFTARRRRA